MAREEYLSPRELRARFNVGGYYERAQSGELSLEITDIGRAPARFPKTVRSQIVTYLSSTGRTLAITHQYGYANGDVVEGTLPDPKFLFEDGIRYKPLRSRGRSS